MREKDKAACLMLGNLILDVISLISEEKAVHFILNPKLVFRKKLDISLYLIFYLNSMQRQDNSSTVSYKEDQMLRKHFKAIGFAISWKELGPISWL